MENKASIEDQVIAKFSGKKKPVVEKKVKPKPARPSVAIDGADLLDEAHAYLGRFVSYPAQHAHVAHTLWIAHTHLMDAWESTPRIAFLSPEPGS